MPWVLSVALHAAAILFLLPKLLAAPAAPHRPEVIQVRLTTPAAEARANEEMPPFTELPADRADEKPQAPEFLSNVTSRARDLVPGGDTDRPRLEGEVDAPAVQLERGKTPSAPDATSPSPSSEPAGLEAADPRPGGKKPGATSLVPVPAAALVRDPAGSAGIDQPAGSDPGGNATLLGDVSLSTIAWDYAPWLQRFGAQLQERWYAPPAYMMGVLKEGGWALLELEITRSGRVQRLVLLDEQGHPSLIRAAESALRSMVPIEPLPADFPEPTLTLRIRMIYPRIRSG